MRTHYLVFDTEDDAEQASQAAARLGHDVDLMELPTGEGCACLVTEGLGGGDEVERELTELAVRRRGGYDGSQTTV